MSGRRNVRWPVTVRIRPVVEIDPAAVERLLAEISSNHAEFGAILDAETGEILLGGCDERELEQKVVLLKDRMSGEIEVGPIEAGYRETVCRPAEAEFTSEIPAFGAGQFARVKLTVEPVNYASDFEFQNDAPETAVPERYIPAAIKGIESVIDSGVLIGFPLIGVKINLADGAYDEARSSVRAFEIAAREALREAILKAEPVLVEPILKIEVAIPESRADDLMADFASRRGTLLKTKHSDGVVTLTALVPVGNLFGYENTLAAITGGRGSYSAIFSHYDTVPRNGGNDPPSSEPGAAALRA